MSAVNKLPALWAEVAGQWASSLRLRAGLTGIVLIVWVYVLLLVADQASALRGETQALREELARIQPIARERGWTQRAEDARQQLAAAQAMLWVDTDAGLIEARFQDWLRGTASKAGLSLRELNLQRGNATLRAAGASQVAASEPLALGARMVVDLQRLPLLAFLAEVGRNEQVIVIERLSLRAGAQPALAEIELRVLGRARVLDAGSEVKP